MEALRLLDGLEGFVVSCDTKNKQGGRVHQENTRSRRSARNYCNCECGGINRQMRIVGGTFTRSHEFPWIAGLSNSSGLQCGATLISKRHLITAAHCVDQANIRDLFITLGDHDRQASDRFNDIEVRGIKSIRKHEYYDGLSHNNDIAILEIDIPIIFNEKMRPICLPNEEHTDYAGRVGIVAGWGKTSEGGEISDILRKAAVPVWTSQECYNSLYHENKISGNMFCAGYPDGRIDACKGDSGGPFQMSNDLGDMELVGIVSFGKECALPNFPGVYTKVVNYLHWINEQLDGECICQNDARYFNQWMWMDFPLQINVAPRCSRLEDAKQKTHFLGVKEMKEFSKRHLN